MPQIKSLSSRQLDFFPLAANDGGTNFLGALALTIHLVGQENLLETNLSVSGVIVLVTIQQTAVPEASVAIAIARLLHEHFRNAARRFVGFLGRRAIDLGGGKRLRKRLGFLRIVEIMRDVLRYFRRRSRS